MKIDWKTLLAAAAVASLVACGDDSDDDGDSSSSTGSSSSVEGSSSSAGGSSSSVASSSSSTPSSSSSSSLACASATLEGTISKDKRLCEGTTYELVNFVIVDSGATLFIEPGVQVKSEGKSALAVMPGSKIMAEGTASKPIVFTSKKALPAPGDWAGICIFGNATVSTPDHTQKFEANEDWVFGGDVENDNSGVLKYVRVEYAGYKVALDKELNAFTFGGVGSGTTLSYLQAYEGSDDSYEWFGGTVDADHLVSVGGEDDGWDIDQGFHGTISYGILIQNDTLSDRAIEAGSVANDPNRITSATFDHVTIFKNKMTQAIHDKDNVAIRLKNSVIVATSDSTIDLIKVEGSVSRNQVSIDSTYFEDVFYSGKFKNLANVVDTTDAANAATLSGLLADGLTEIDVASPFNSDLTLKTSNAKTAGAGAVTSSDLWYEGWTKAGTIALP